MLTSHDTCPVHDTQINGLFSLLSPIAFFCLFGFLQHFYVRRDREGLGCHRLLDPLPVMLAVAVQEILEGILVFYVSVALNGVWLG